MSKNPYSSRLWLDIREQILIRDNCECYSCHSKPETNKLHVHHYVYIRGAPIQDIHPDLLVTLCERCHSDWHKTNQTPLFDNEDEALIYVREKYQLPVGRDIRLDFPVATKIPITISNLCYDFSTALSDKISIGRSSLIENIIKKFIYFAPGKRMLISERIDNEINSEKDFRFLMKALGVFLKNNEYAILRYLQKCKSNSQNV